MRHILLIACVVVGSAGCGSTAPGAEAPGNADAEFKDTVNQYTVEFLRRNPTVNTYLGGAGLNASLRDVDGTLRDHSASALQQEDQWLTQTQSKIQAFAPESLSSSARVDRNVALAQIAFQLRLHQVRRYQERALDTYVSEPFRAIDWQLQGMTQTGASTSGTPEEWTLVIRRVNAISTFFERAREQLAAGVKSNNLPDGRMIRRDGINTAEATAKYFADTLPALAAERISGFVLKARSPSCGPVGVLVHHEDGYATPSGRGLFAEALVAAMPGLPTIDEEWLEDEVARADFIQRVRQFAAGSARTNK